MLYINVYIVGKEMSLGIYFGIKIYGKFQQQKPFLPSTFCDRLTKTGCGRLYKNNYIYLTIDQRVQKKIQKNQQQQQHQTFCVFRLLRKIKCLATFTYYLFQFVKKTTLYRLHNQIFPMIVFSNQNNTPE